MTDVDPSAEGRRGLPKRRVTMSQLVAYNMSAFRKAAGLSQQELGERLSALGGWSAASVSAAERSWDGKRVKKFDADEMMEIANALGVPLVALFLPPEDHGTAVSYIVRFSGPRLRDLDYLLNLVLPMNEGDTPAMKEYRKRLIVAGIPIGLADLTESMAQMRARRILDEMRQDDRERNLEAGMPEEAERVISEARAQARELEKDAQERYRDVLGSLMKEREELISRVNDLRTFERDYRTRLQVFMEGQLLDLWTPELREEKERSIEEVRKRATRRKGNRTRAVLLREDGTYDVLNFGRSGETASRPQGESQAAEEGSTQ